MNPRVKGVTTTGIAGRLDNQSSEKSIPRRSRVHQSLPFTHHGLTIEFAANVLDVLVLLAWNIGPEMAYVGALKLHEAEVGHQTNFLDAAESLEVIFNIGLGGI